MTHVNPAALNNLPSDLFLLIWASKRRFSKNAHHAQQTFKAIFLAILPGLTMKDITVDTVLVSYYVKCSHAARYRMCSDVWSMLRTAMETQSSCAAKISTVLTFSSDCKDCPTIVCLAVELLGNLASPAASEWAQRQIADDPLPHRRAVNGVVGCC